MQPDVGHEVLWVVRDCLSGTVILARSLLSATVADLAPLLREAPDVVGVPVLGMVSDGQASVRLAVAEALPGVPPTNNDLEHLFGCAPCHERRATGRKAASPAAALRGPVRIIAATATRTQPSAARDLGRADRSARIDLRRRLDARRQAKSQ